MLRFPMRIEEGSRRAMRCKLALVLASLVMASCSKHANVPEPRNASTTTEETPLGEPATLWAHNEALDRVKQAILATAPITDTGQKAASHPGRPFTFEEQVYDKPRRDWWWAAAKYTVILAGGLVVAYASAGFLAPWVGGAIGSMSGLSGAAAVSQGLAFLGGGAIAAGGFGMAGGTFLVGVITDFAVSTALEYSLTPISEEKRFAKLSEAIKTLDSNQEQPAAWAQLEREAVAAASHSADYVSVVHAVASACMRWAGDEGLSRALQERDAEVAATRISDRQRALMATAFTLLEEARRLEPKSSLIHHAIGNAYWWLSVRGGYPQNALQVDGLPQSARVSWDGADEEACFEAALWHYGAGATAEPRNAPLRNNWAMALQANGTTHEAIAVIDGVSAQLSGLRKSDQALLLRASGMLHYQAFLQSSGSERPEDEGGFPGLNEAPMLMASLHAYSKAAELEKHDVSSLSSLLQIYNSAPMGRISAAPTIMPEEEVRLRFVEAVLEQEKALAAIPVDRRPSGYAPGQFLSHYRELLRAAFDGLLGVVPTGEELTRVHSIVCEWLSFVEENGIGIRPFSRDGIIRLRAACAEYNKTVTLSWVWGYALDALDHEMSRNSEDP